MILTNKWLIFVVLRGEKQVYDNYCSYVTYFILVIQIKYCVLTDCINKKKWKIKNFPYRI